MPNHCPHCGKEINEGLGRKQAKVITALRAGMSADDLRRCFWTGDKAKSGWAMRKMIRALRDKGFRIELDGRGAAASYRLKE